jgi:hypothetical protein
MNLQALIEQTAAALAAAEPTKYGLRTAVVTLDGVTCTMTATAARGWHRPARTTTQFKRDGKVISRAALAAEARASVTSVVADAVAPLKDGAVQRAAEAAAQFAESALAKLADAGWDLQVAAPYPDSGIGRAAYRAATELRSLLSSLTMRADPTGLCRRPGDPDIRKVSPTGVAAFVNRAKEATALSFDAYVAKMVDKVGHADSAEICGGSVWNGSVLTVRKGEVTERWHTQQIVNCSGLGTLFNQWPTRLMK